MIFKRKIYAELLSWKEKWASRRALLIQGARRIGKSTIVEEFAKKEYRSYILINFQTDLRNVETLFQNRIFNLDSFFRELSLLYGVKLYQRESLIIFDEVQLFPLARQSIKQFVADGRYDFIETGSLISLKQNVDKILIPSEERRINMYPMDFEEFMWARGERNTFEIIRQCFNEGKPLGEAAHRKIIGEYRLYLTVGGMPQAVSELLNSNDFADIDEVKRDILNLYHDDLKKLDSRYRLSTSMIFEAIPSELSSKSRLFRAVALGENARVNRKYSSYEAIKDSMIVNIAYNCSDPSVGLNLNRDYSRQKIYMADTGLLVTQIFADSDKRINDSIYRQLIVGKLGINMGMIFENAIAAALKVAGHELYFHKFDRYEIDFLCVEQKKLLPIEVKSSSYRSHKSIDRFADKYSDRLKTSYVIYGKDLKREGNITFIPFYMAGLVGFEKGPRIV